MLLASMEALDEIQQVRAPSEYKNYRSKPRQTQRISKPRKNEELIPSIEIVPAASSFKSNRVRETVGAAVTVTRSFPQVSPHEDPPSSFSEMKQGGLKFESNVFESQYYVTPYEANRDKVQSDSQRALSIKPYGRFLNRVAELLRLRQR